MSVKQIIEQVEKGKMKLTDNIQKGNYGEMKMDQYYERQGYVRISQDRVMSLDEPVHQGIDGIYYNVDKQKREPTYIIAEVKCNHIMMRDKFKSKEYFDEYIEKQSENFKEFKELLEDESVLKERLQLLKEMLFDYKLNIIIARYSRGDSIDEIVSDYNELLELWKETCNLASIEAAYEENLWFISFGILLGEKEIIEEIRRTLEHKEINDWLFNFLLSTAANNADQIGGDLLMLEKYQNLKKTICTLDKKQFIHYVEKEWYHSCKDFGWYDSHKLTKRSQHIYFGYWCFEVGAIVKLLKWEDSDLKEQQYYPYDLVHYKE